LIPIPTSLIEILPPLLFLAFLILFFLPAILELKRPRDAGPRKVANVWPNFTVNEVKFGLSSLLGLDDIEKEDFTERRIETMNMPVRNLIFSLANIEV
jgi:hypothetical protein